MINFLKRYKILLAIWTVVAIGFYMVEKSSAKDTVSSPVITQRVMISNGESRTQVSVTVGSTTPVSPFASIPTGPGSTTTSAGFISDAVGAQLTEIRNVGFVNDTSFYVRLGTWSLFTPAQSFWTVGRASVTLANGPLPYYETTNRATFYMLLEEGANPSSGTIKVKFEK